MVLVRRIGGEVALPEGRRDSASSKRAFLPRATAAILAAAMSSLLVCAFTRGADGYSSGGDSAGLLRKLTIGIAPMPC